MRPLRDVKSTNYFWLGDIPSTWKLPKTAWHFKIGMGETILGESLVEKGIPVYSATEKDHFFGYVSKANLHLEKGDLVVPARGNSIGHVKIVSQLSTTTQTTIYLKKLSDLFESKFVYWFMKGFKGDLFPFVQTAIPQLTVDEVSKNPILQPPLYEQRQIAAYLNRETAKIDNLIAKQQKLIKLLQEKRQTVISQTVTKGLDPNVKMKDSGVEWLGEVPQHWNLLRGKSLFKIRKRIAGRLGFEILSITQKGIKVKDTESGGGQLSMDYSKYQLVIPGDFAMNHMDLLTGYVDISKYHGVTSPDYRVFEMKGDQDTFCSIFYKSVLQNCYHEKLFFPFGQGSSQLGRWRLPTEAFNEFVYPVPPIDEQRAIAKFIEVEISKCELLTDKANTCISLLKEHRQALITAAVTGKIDVRGLVTDEEVAALDADPVLETTEEDFESEVAEADYITEEE